MAPLGGVSDVDMLLYHDEPGGPERAAMRVRLASSFKSVF